jgi:molybdopterin molybdotransferase
MISHEEAIHIILSSYQIADKENVELLASLNRVLASDIVSDMHMPPFDKSAVDGYACRKEDLSGPLEVIETIAAGFLPTLEVGKGQCSKIMTGAKVPLGADVVIMVEDTEDIANNTVRFIQQKTATNICLLGEDMKPGDLLVKKGTIISPQHLGIMASIGITSVPVSCKIKVGIIATGDELQEPGEQLQEGKIRNSNAWQLMGSCLEMQAQPSYYGIVADELRITQSTLEKAISENDIVLLTGGVSMGDFDFVPQALTQAGFEIKFDSVAMQPGRPLTYATNGKKHCFGLPGNPVSSFLQFELSVKPLIYNMAGHQFQPMLIPLQTAVPIVRKKTSRKSFYPVELTTDFKIQPAGYHGSAHINAFSSAYGIIAMEQGVAEIKEGEIVYVRPL